MHEHTTNALIHDKVSLVRESVHRSRRAIRVDLAGIRKLCYFLNYFLFPYFCYLYENIKHGEYFKNISLIKWS